MKAARFRMFHRVDRLATMLAMAAVLLRCVIAPGVMLDPMAAAQGKLQLVICTPTGAKSIAAASDQSPLPHQRSEGEGEVCPYAALGPLSVPANPVTLGAERLQPAFETPARDAAHRSAHRGSFAARAPPKLS
jgi:hypothetical protein